MSRSYVIRDAHVLSQDPAVGDLPRADLLLADGLIVAIGPDLGPLDAQSVDGAGCIALPGFVDTHRHSWQSLIRHMSTDWTLPQYFSGVRGVLGRAYQPDDMYAANRLAMLEALDAGITTIVDWSHNNNSPDHADAAVSAVLDSGIRAVWAYGNANDEWLPVSDVPLSRDVVRVAERWFTGRDQRVTLALALRGPQFATPEATAHDFALARELDVPVTVHVGDGTWGRSRPLDWLDARGLADARTTYVHCNTIADDEFDVIARTGGAVSVAPELEMHMGHGELATLRARGRGITTGISIDVCTSVGGDMFSAMRAMLAGTRYLVNLDALDRDTAIERLPLTATDVLRMATADGARVAWLADQVGSLTPGKRADVILVRADGVSMRPLNYPAGAVIESGHPGLVDTVFVDGVPVKRGGRLLGPDVAGVIARAEQARDGLFARAGVTDPGRWVPPVYPGS
jgi:cytosine/adenosine deaminase-related metal-dependent hydrolase